MLLGQKTQRPSDQMVSIRSSTEIAIPPKRVQSPPKITNSRRCRYFKSSSSQETAMYSRILENEVWERKSLLRSLFINSCLRVSLLPLVFVRFLREDCIKERGMERRRKA